jgi:hypothetical protein
MRFPMKRLLISLAAGILLPVIYAVLIALLIFLFPSPWWNYPIYWNRFYISVPALFPVFFGETIYMGVGLKLSRNWNEIASFCATFFSPIFLYGGSTYLFLRQFNWFAKQKPQGIETPPPPPEFFEK